MINTYPSGRYRYCIVFIQSVVSALAERRLRVFFISLVLANIGGVLGIVLALQRGRPGFLALTVVLLTGILLADVVLFVLKRGSAASVNRLTYGQVAERFRPAGDVRLPVSMLFFSVFVLMVVGRGGLWNVSISSFFFLMFVRFYLTDYDSVPVGVDVALLMVGAGLLIGSQTLTVPFYAFTRDTVYHSAVATRIAEYGLNTVTGTRYDDLLAFHVLVATGLEMTGTSARTFAAVLFVAVFPVVVPVALAVVRALGFPSTLGLVAGLAVVVNPEFIMWGSQAHPQSLSFVFFVCFILFLNRQTDHIRSLPVILPLAGVWVMTHHLSVFMSIVLLAVPVTVGILRWALVRRSVGSSFVSIESSVLNYFILVVVTVVYWWEVGVIREAQLWLTTFSPRASEGVETTASVIVTYDDPTRLVFEAVPSLLSDLHYGFWIGFVTVGIWTLFKSERVSLSQLPLILISVLAASVFYFPNPTWIPLRGIAFLPRWGIMTLPFIAVAATLTLNELGQSILRRGPTILPLVFVLLLLTVSVSSGFSDPSVTDFSGYEKGERKYLSTADMAATSHTIIYSNPEMEVSSGGILNNYFILQDWTRRPDSTRRSGPWLDRYERIQVIDGRLETDEGLTVLQKKAFEEKGLKMAIVNPEGPAYQDVGDITVLSSVSDEDVTWSEANESVVYSNGETIIIYR